MNQPAPLSHTLDELEQIVRDAGALALGYFGTPVRAWEKNPNDPVSEADLAVNDLLHERLQIDHETGWLSEESRDDPERLSKAATWVVDPIDGTRAFLRGDPSFAVSVALVQNGRPVLGAVYRPASDEMYLAQTGCGASLNGKSLKVSKRKSLEGCKIFAEKELMHDARHWPLQWPQMRYLSLPALALRLSSIGAGRAEAMISLRPKCDWDLAAADLILHEAGGICLDETGAPLNYNQPSARQSAIIATTPHLLDAIRQRIDPALAGIKAAGLTKGH
ncbi:inositol-1-monophosphatase [alpha proteobacterium Q-1]|nr:inositol-1-monophosphatase [alpha proteobacterium Q-1]